MRIREIHIHLNNGEILSFSNIEYLMSDGILCVRGNKRTTYIPIESIAFYTVEIN